MKEKNSYEAHKEEIFKLLENGDNSISSVAKIIWSKYFKESKQDTVRIGITRLVGKYSHSGVKEAITQKNNIPFGQVSGYWDKSNKEFSVYVKPNQFEVEQLEDFLNFDFSGVERIKHNPTPITNYDFDRAIYTDVHIGMNPNARGNAMYAEDWNEKILLNDCERFAEHILIHRQSPVLYLDDLGDFLDGYDAKTTRGGHELPQNMTTQEAFDAGFKFKIKLASILAPFYEKIIMNNICNDNHSGAFGYCLNSAVKKYVELRHSNIEVCNHLKFINHYSAGDCLFVISHGKDDKALKFGFKPTLDANLEKKILNYLKHYSLLSKFNYIQFDKGDSHQYKFDNDSSEFFRYYNYPAFSPSSEWVQSNFQKGKRGAIMFNFKNSGQKTISELFF